ncbi:glycosyltransferase family 4 protein [Methyloraptor flagellatus]|uniref:Glycosyltransferase family 4 protein n=1 Tax=Methyloraptor flagellatus TaxID=3162530 RepID=A0AAU7X8F7_9HYPH
MDPIADPTIRAVEASLARSAAAVASDRPLRIVHVVRQYLPNRGGLEDVVAHLAREQLKAGWPVRIVTLDRLFRAPEVRLPAREVIDGIPVERIPWRGSSRYPFAPGVFRHLADADLVHVHAVDFFYDWLAFGRLLHGKPTVATTHGGFFHTVAHSRLKKLWFNGPTRLSTRLHDAVVACSASDAMTFAPLGGRIVTIENGVDLSKFADAASATPVRTMVTIGRFSDNKRLDRLIATTAALVRRDPAWRLVICGAESDWTVARLGVLVREHGIETAVSIETGLDDAALAGRIATASLFVSASTYEGFGLALIEAMSAGLSPVVFPNASFRALAARHPTIALADYEDPAAAADAIETVFARLAADPAGMRAAAIAETVSYGWPRVAAEYAALYRSVLAARG